MDITLHTPKDIPRERALDSTIALMREGYGFMPARFRAHDSDIFATRLMLRRAICVMGEEASRMFFHPGRFTRRGALPPNTLLSLQDLGSVQMMDGPPHHARKQLFMQLATPASVAALVDLFTTRWRARMAAWEQAAGVVLHTEMEELLCRSACAWAGLPLTDAEAAERTHEFAAMIDGAGAMGPRNWRGLMLRSRTERWARERIAEVRAGRREPPPGTALDLVVRHRDPGGRPLDDRVAAVELLNAIRPTVAVARYITFAALALHEHPECRGRLVARDDAYAHRFALEVRRRYPFFTALGGRALRSFEWAGHHFPRGSWVLFDVWGTLMDPRIWREPERFDPDRFLQRGPGGTEYSPQGGGEYATGHRCPGEPATIALVKCAATMLASMTYDVPQQDLTIDLRRMPAIPASRFLIANVRG